jgi:hypothetical protein
MIFWVVTPYKLVGGSKERVAWYAEKIYIYTYQTTRRHKPEGRKKVSDVTNSRNKSRDYISAPIRNNIQAGPSFEWMLRQCCEYKLHQYK